MHAAPPVSARLRLPRAVPLGVALLAALAAASAAAWGVGWCVGLLGEVQASGAWTLFSALAAAGLGGAACWRSGALGLVARAQGLLAWDGEFWTFEGAPGDPRVHMAWQTGLLVRWQATNAGACDPHGHRWLLVHDATLGADAAPLRVALLAHRPTTGRDAVPPWAAG